MSEPTVSDRFVSITAVAGQTVLAFDFELVRPDGLKVICVRDGVHRPLDLGVDYSFPDGLGGPAGGTLKLHAQALAGDVYLLIGLLPEIRVSDLLGSQAFKAEKFNSDLDYLTVVAQEHRRDIERSMKLEWGSAAIPPGHIPISTPGGNFGDGGAAADIAQALNALFDFRAQYLGRHPSNPIADPNGYPVQSGAFYWNTTSNVWIYWDGDSWEAWPSTVPPDGSLTLQKLTASLRAIVSPLGQIIVILVTGQSNIAIMEPLAWSPPKNLYVWDWNGVDETTVGTAFTAADPTHIGCGHSYAAEVARENPGAAVYLINIGRGSQPIAQWMAGAATPKMFDACKLNVDAALAVLGVDHIHRILWWQGESDYQAGYGTYSQYPANFEAVMTRFYGQSWCPPSTPVIVMGTSQFYASGSMDQSFNPVLRQVVDADPQRRVYVNLKALDATYWMPPDGIHMVGIGYREAGRLAYLTGERGLGQNRKSTSSYRRSKSGTASKTNSAALTPDVDLMVFVKGTCRVRFLIIGDTSLAAGFKWGISGPASGYIGWRARWTTENFPGTENVDMGSGYPASKAFTSASGKFILEIDLFHNGPSGAPDNLLFHWSQATADVAATLVLATSTVELIEAP